MPSSDFNFILPSSPLRRIRWVSAGVTARLKKDSRVILNTQSFCFIKIPRSEPQIVSFGQTDGPAKVRYSSGAKVTDRSPAGLEEHPPVIGRFYAGAGSR